MAKKSSAKERLVARMKKGMDKGGSDYENTSIFKQGLELKYWKVDEGKHFFDIVPYIAGKNDPDVDEGDEAYCFQPYMHRNVGPNDRDMICIAKTYGKPCPICEYRKELISEGADEDLIKEIKVQRNPRAIYNVLVQDNKEEIKKGVQIFHTSHYVMEGPLLELANKPMRPGSDKPEAFVPYPSADEDGKTIYFKRKGTGLGTEYLALSFEDRDKALSDDILKQAHTLDELVYIPTYEEARAALHGEEEDREEEVVKEEEEVVEESNEQDELRTELEGMSRLKLKQYNKENKCGVSIKPKMKDEEIVEAIMEAMGKEEIEEVEEGVCPHGGNFGEDLDELDQCEDCDMDIWKACAQKAEEMEE